MGYKEKEIKGVWVLDYVKTIRESLPDKKEEFDKWLKDEDWAIINTFVIPSEYYPYSCWQRIGYAVFIVVAQRNLELARFFGRQVTGELLKHYKRLLNKGQVISSLENFCHFHYMYFKNVDSRASLSSFEPTQATIHLELAPSDKEMPEAAEAFAWQLAGSFEELAIQAGAQNLEVTIHQQQGDFIYNLAWQ